MRERKREKDRSFFLFFTFYFLLSISHLFSHFLSLFSSFLSRCISNFGYLNNLKVWKVSNPDIISRFERKSGNLLRVPCWIDTTTLPEGDSIDEISKYGFRFHSTPGFYFRTGSLIDSPELTSSNTFQLVYCEVAIGRSRVNDNLNPSSRIPPGFDSFYLPIDKLDRNEDGEFSINEYQAAAHFNYREPKFLFLLLLFLSFFFLYYYYFYLLILLINYLLSLFFFLF